MIQAATLVTFLDLGSEYKVKKEISKIAFGRIDSSGGLKNCYGRVAERDRRMQGTGQIGKDRPYLVTQSLE